MMFEVPIVLHDKRSHTKRHLSVSISETDTIKTVAEQVSLKTGVPRDSLAPLLCGRIVKGDDVLVKDLLLGPTTSLIVLVIEQPANNKEQTAQNSSISQGTPEIGSFYIWCKRCMDVTRGKLRVYCSSCLGTAVVVKTEPSRWEDVLISKRIFVDCEDCRDPGTSAQFRFKCVSCNEMAAPLSQVRGNWENSACVICDDDSEKFVFDLGCNHATCRECFKKYAETALNESHFVLRAPFGYTLGCPSNGCDHVVRDAHHFHVLGDEKYDRYQKLAAEKLVALHEQGVFCPYPDCNSCFFWENDNEDGSTYCPACLRHFCRNCRSRECTCENPEELTKVTIEATTRKCPRCGADTERQGGCAHIRCTACGENWCYRCAKPWSDSCQWDHWFG